MLKDFLTILTMANKLNPKLAGKLLANANILVPEFKVMRDEIIATFLKGIPSDTTNNKIKVIKYIREHTGMSLLEAKNIVFDMTGTKSWDSSRDSHTV